MCSLALYMREQFCLWLDYLFVQFELSTVVIFTFSPALPPLPLRSLLFYVFYSVLDFLPDLTYIIIAAECRDAQT